MAKMHELLSVEASIASGFSRDTEETLKVFGRPDAFRKEIKKAEFFNAEDEKLNVTEVSDITTTVADRLKWFSGHAVKLFDVLLQKDKTNQIANADLVVGEVVIAKDVPASTLLMLESKLQDVRRVLEAAPTLPAGLRWVEDPAENLFVTVDPIITFKTKKVTKPVVMYEATKEHPAQVKEVSEDVPVAKITKTTWAGTLTSSQKATLLGRVDVLLQAAKKARQRANTADVVKDTFGENIFAFLFKDVVPS